MKAVKTEMGGEVFPGAEPGVELHEMHGLSRSFPPGGPGFPGWLKQAISS